MANYVYKDPVKVGIAEPRPTHDVSLTDNKGNTVGLILTNRLGVRDPKGILEGNMPRTALRTSQGNVGYDDLELPFTAEVQNTMVGGRAQEEFARDRTKYSDGFRMDTTREFPVCGPLEEAQFGINRGIIDYETGPLMTPGFYTSYNTPYQSNEYFKIYFAAEAFITGIDVVIDIPYDGTTIYYGPITENEAHGDHIHMSYSLYVPKKTAWSSALPKDEWLDYRTVHLPFDAHVAAGGYLSFGIATDKFLWIYLDYAATNCSIRQYSDGAWGTAVYSGETMEHHTIWARYYTLANTEHKTLLFEYKRQMYMIQNMSDGTSAPLLYVNGYRGQAADNSANKTTIITGLTLTDIDLTGKIVLIIDGPGENELQPWRRITSNTAAGVCSVSPAWKVTHTTSTSFVILDTNTWTVIGSHGLTKPVTDVAVVNDMVVFCQGANAKLRYMNEYNNAGTWTRQFKADGSYYADRIEPIVNEEGKLLVWRAISDGAKVDCSLAGVYGDTTPLVFDLNKKLRDEQILIITRAEADKTTEQAKATKLIADEVPLIRKFDDLTTEHNRILTEYSRLTGTNKPISDELPLIRQFDDLTVEHNRIIIDYDRLSGTNKPVSDDLELRREFDELTREHNFLITDYTRLTGTNAPISDATTLRRRFEDLTIEHNRILADYARLTTDINKPLSDYDTLVRQFDDLTLQHNRLLADYAGESDAEVKEQMEEADYDIFISKTRLAHSYGTWTMTSPSYTFGKTSGAGHLSHDEMFNTIGSVDDGTDLKIAYSYNEETTLLSRRDRDIYTEKSRLAGSTGTWSITTPTDVTYGNGAPHNQSLGTYTPTNGSDIAIAQSYNDAITQIMRRDYAIYWRKKHLAGSTGTYSITTPTSVTYTADNIAHDAGIGESAATNASLIKIAEQYDEAIAKLSRRDEDIYTEKVRLAGVGTGSWSITNRTYTFGNAGTINHNELFGSNIALAGSDIAIAVAYNEATTDLIQRDADIYTEKKRLAGSNVSTWSDTYIATPTSILYGNNNSIAHNAYFGSSTAKTGSDIALAVANTDDVTDNGYITSLDRIIEDARWQVGDAVNHDPISGHEDVYLKKYLICGNTDARITNLLPYGTPTIPYIIKEDSIGSIQTGIYDEIPIAELRTVRSEDNGIAAMAYGVYLYFSMAGTMIERYYDQRLDDVGPNRADGLPRERQGVIRKMVPYPGRYYIAIDGGSNGYSSILCSNELGWHEIYRMPVMGRSITDLWIQTIPGDDNTDRLWVGCENSVFKLPVAINPLNQVNYQYYGYGVANPYIITSWIDYGMKDVNKYFHSVTLFADYPLGRIQTGREFEIIVSYRLNENDDWKLAGTTINEPAFPQEIELDRINHSVSGKKIQLKFEFKINSSASFTPRLKAWVLNGILRMPVKKSWQLTFALEPPEDLQDRKLKQARNLLIDQLNTWANSKVHNTPLVMRTCDIHTDNKLVFIDPASVSLINVVLEQNRGNTIKQYDHLASLTVYEV